MRRKATKRLSTSLKLGPCRHRPDIVGSSGWVWARPFGWLMGPTKGSWRKEMSRKMWESWRIFHLLMGFTGISSSNFFLIWFWVNFSSVRGLISTFNVNWTWDQKDFPFQWQLNIGQLPVTFKGCVNFDCHLSKRWQKKTCEKKTLGTRPASFPVGGRILPRVPMYTKLAIFKVGATFSKAHHLLGYFGVSRCVSFQRGVLSIFPRWKLASRKVGWKNHHFHPLGCELCPLKTPAENDPPEVQQNPLKSYQNTQ